MKDPVWKRAFDVAASLAAGVVFSPAIAMAAVAVYAGMGPPVLFRQRRPGRHGRPFTILKFRTMTEPPDPARAAPDDARLTRVGRVLRASSLDELPQLWNVLRGDMSLVGPRPLLERYLPYFRERERLRLEVRPGITGWAQIHGRNTAGWDERLELDAWYVEHLSPRLDLRILWRTVRKVLGRDGVVLAPGTALQDLDVARRDAAPGIRPARPADADEVVRIARGGVPPQVLPHTIFGAAGAGAFLRERLARGAEVLVADDGTGVTGFVELRHLDGALFLNDVYVREDRRGAGLARRLLAEGIARFRRPREATLALDVFAESDVAMRWYAALGLAPAGVTEWRMARLPPSFGSNGWRAEGLARADHQHAQFGVAELAIHDGNGRRYAVGWIDAFRVRTTAILRDRAALAFLASLRRSDRILCIAPPDGRDRRTAAAEPLARSTRMAGRVDDVIARLRARRA